jgi:hypothetical protein
MRASWLGIETGAGEQMRRWFDLPLKENIEGLRVNRASCSRFVGRTCPESSVIIELIAQVLKNFRPKGLGICQ